MENIVIYFRPECPYSQRSLDTIEKLAKRYPGLQVTKNKVTQPYQTNLAPFVLPHCDKESSQTIKSKNAALTKVPQIIVNGKYIGGSDDFHEFLTKAKFLQHRIRSAPTHSRHRQTVTSHLPKQIIHRLQPKSQNDDVLDKLETLDDITELTTDEISYLFTRLMTMASKRNLL